MDIETGGKKMIGKYKTKYSTKYYVQIDKKRKYGFDTEDEAIVYEFKWKADINTEKMNKANKKLEK